MVDIFNKYFKKGDQVFVGFREGNSHGYVSKIDENGVYLIQLNHSKEYFYNWNQCEVICTAGYHIKKVKSVVVDNLITISINGNQNKEMGSFHLYDGWDRRKNSLALWDNFIKEKFNFKITINRAEEIMEKEFPELWGLYCSVLYDNASRIKNLKGNKEIKSNSKETFLITDDSDEISLQLIKQGIFKNNGDGCKDSLVFEGDCVTGAVFLSYRGLVTELRNNESICTIDVQSLGKFSDILIQGPILLSNSIHAGRNRWKPLDLTIENVKLIKKTTRKQLSKFTDKFSYIYSGDPYELSGEFITPKLLKSEQGWCILNKNAELFATVGE